MSSRPGLRTTLAPMLRASGVLGAFALAAAALLAGTHLVTRDPIARAERERLVSQLNAVVPRHRYDNDLAADTTQVRDPALGVTEPVTAYRARRLGAPVAVVLSAVAPDGYSGPIHLLIGIDADGRLAGVRVTAHRETPGLGDRIDLDVGDWILGFAGRSLGSPPPARWAVRKDGGDFDQFAGATITPRAVVRAVRRALEFFGENRDRLFAPMDPP